MQPTVSDTISNAASGPLMKKESFFESLAQNITHQQFNIMPTVLKKFKGVF